MKRYEYEWCTIEELVEVFRGRTMTVEVFRERIKDYIIHDETIPDPLNRDYREALNEGQLTYVTVWSNENDESEGYTFYIEIVADEGAEDKIEIKVIDVCLF